MSSFRAGRLSLFAVGLALAAMPLAAGVAHSDTGTPPDVAPSAAAEPRDSESASGSEASPAAVDATVVGAGVESTPEAPSATDDPASALEVSPSADGDPAIVAAVAASEPTVPLPPHLALTQVMGSTAGFPCLATCWRDIVNPVQIGQRISYWVDIINEGGYPLDEVVFTDTHNGTAAAALRLDCTRYLHDPAGNTVSTDSLNVGAPFSLGLNDWVSCSGDYTVVKGDYGLTVTNTISATAKALVDGQVVDVVANDGVPAPPLSFTVERDPFAPDEGNTDQPSTDNGSTGNESTGNGALAVVGGSALPSGASLTLVSLSCLMLGGLLVVATRRRRTEAGHSPV